MDQEAKDIWTDMETIGLLGSRLDQFLSAARGTAEKMDPGAGNVTERAFLYDSTKTADVCKARGDKVRVVLARLKEQIDGAEKCSELIRELMAKAAGTVDEENARRRRHGAVHRGIKA